MQADGGVFATATSTYSGYPASNVLDFDVSTSWYIDSTCFAWFSLSCCAAESILLNLAQPRTLVGVVLRGNRGAYEDGYDFLTGRLDFYDASAALIATRTVVFNRPDGDWATTLSPPVPGVRAVRFTPGLAEDSASGIADIRLYAQ